MDERCEPQAQDQSRPASETDSAKQRDDAIVWAGRVLTLLACFPLFVHIQNQAPGDWDYFATIYEVTRRTILEYGQFPWWDPWVAGGTPLAANPQSMLFSIFTPFVLVFGAIPGLKIALAFHFLIGFEGARRLAARFTPHALFQCVAATIFTLNSSQTLGANAGLFAHAQNFYLPWLLLFAFGLKDSLAAALAFGAVEGLMMLMIIHYINIYAFIFAHLILAMEFLRHRAERRTIVVHWLMASALCLGLCGFRVLISWQYFSQYPRETDRWLHLTPLLLARMLMQPWMHINVRFAGLSWWEFGCYVGVLPVVLFFVSMRPRFRVWHALALACFVLSYSSASPWWPGTWVRQLPLFKSMWVVTRWRIPGLLFLGMAVALGLSHWYETGGKRLKALTVTGAVLVIADILVSTYPSWQTVAWGDPPRRTFPFFLKLEDIRPDAPPAAYIRSHKEMRLYNLGSCMLPYIRSNLAVIDAYEPLLGYEFERRTSRRGWGQPGYRGEFAVDGQPVKPLFWSPNRIVLPAKQGSRVYLNQNPGCYWIVNGKRPWPDKKVFDLDLEWDVVNDREGTCEIALRPPGAGAGLVLSAAGLGACVALISVRELLRRRRTRAMRRPAADPKASEGVGT